MIPFEDIRRGMFVRADIGQHMVDVRAVDVIDINRDNETVTVTLGDEEMAGPYIIPASRVRELLHR